MLLTFKDMENQNQMHEQFASLPLGEKFSMLFKMELATIGEAVDCLAKEPMKFAEKLGDVITEFGNRVESEFRKATKAPDEQQPNAKKKSGKKNADTTESGDDGETV